MSYVYSDVSEFRVKEKIFSLTGDVFTIKREPTNEDVFKIEPSLISLHEKKKLKDIHGNTIFMMKEKIMSFRDRMYIEDASGNVVYTLRKKSMVPMMGTRTVYVWKGDDDEGEPWLQLKGDLIKRKFKITSVADDREAAVVSRKLFNLQSVILDNDSYVVRVNPGFDAALMVLLAVAIDEHYHD